MTDAEAAPPSPSAARGTLLRAGVAIAAVALLVSLAFAFRPERGRSEGAERGTGRSAVQPQSPAAPPRPLSAARTERRTFASQTLGRRMPYLVFLPPGYDSEDAARYPVLYMLHGLGGDLTEWTEYGLFEEAERLIRARAIPKLLIVLPEGGQSYWVDHAGGGPRWGTYVARDVTAAIDGRYRTLVGRNHRAVGGNSMGAHAALQLPMNFPDVFGVGGAHSPTLRGRETLPAYFGDQAHFEAHDPATLIARDPARARSLRLWLDIGDGDFFLGIVTEFHRRLDALGVVHEFHVRPGPHDDEYWRRNVGDYLRFYGAALSP